MEIVMTSVCDQHEPQPSRLTTAGVMMRRLRVCHVDEIGAHRSRVVVKQAVIEEEEGWVLGRGRVTNVMTVRGALTEKSMLLDEQGRLIAMKDG